MLKRTRLAVWSCLHAPTTPVENIDWLVSVLAEARADWNVNLGDWANADAASVHASRTDDPLKDEYRMMADQSREIRAVVKRGSSLIWMEGNHEKNLRRRDRRRVPEALLDSVHWNNDIDFGPEFRKWRQIPRNFTKAGILQCGDVLLWHGWRTGKTSDTLEGLRVCQMLNRWGVLTVRGHTHQPTEPTQSVRASVSLPHWYTNVGTIGPQNPEWAEDMDTVEWGPAVAIIETAGRGEGFSCELIKKESSVAKSVRVAGILAA